MLTFGCIDYVNTYPLIGSLLESSDKIEGIRIHKDVPQKLNQSLLEGKLDVSFLSSIEYLKHQDSLTLITPFCIAAKEELCKSVYLYTRVSLKDLDHSTIYLSSQSSTACSLLKVLCHHFWKVHPSFEILTESPPDFDKEACLLIGDEALNPNILPHYSKIDLAHSWFLFTGKPFVFAVICCLTEKLNKNKKAILRLKNLLLDAQRNSKYQIQTLKEKASHRLKIPSEYIEEYYKVLSYNLSPEHMQSLNLFYDYFLNIGHHHAINS